MFELLVAFALYLILLSGFGHLYELVAYRSEVAKKSKASAGVSVRSDSACGEASGCALLMDEVVVSVSFVASALCIPKLYFGGNQDYLTHFIEQYKALLVLRVKAQAASLGITEIINVRFDQTTLSPRFGTPMGRSGFLHLSITATGVVYD